MTMKARIFTLFAALCLLTVTAFAESAADIRRRMALVPQEGQLFAASARDNLRYGNWDASDDDIWEAARAANAERFLRDLPEGLDTFLGEGGARLSGGFTSRDSLPGSSGCPCTCSISSDSETGSRSWCSGDTRT